MSTHILDLPESPRASVFRSMEQIVRSDPTFQRIVKPHSFRTWSGHPQDAREFTFEIAPAVRWTPTNGPEKFATPEMLRGPLYVNCEILLQGTNADDMQNFWKMFVDCFYPGQPQSDVIKQQLRTAGAFTGLVLFSQPAYDPQPDGVWMAGGGQMTIEVRSTIDL